MALVPGSRIGHYDVIGAIGSGGMGEVYRARDTKLGREVAIKVLPEAFASDPERLVRFEREAKSLAALNHPHIAQIYGMEDIGTGGRALVMELVDGDDLSRRIAGHRPPEAESVGSRPRDTNARPARGGGAPRGLSIDDTLAIAKQIAEALEAAHEHGIIHRDLKPANVKVREDGAVKVLDFGLAKAMEPASARGDSAGQAPLSQSPTITTPAMTQAGMILGTAAYMSPEQARGRTADKRSDIWSFGVVVLEMLTGRRVFGGEEISDVLAAVLRQEVDWTALPAETPEPLRQLLRRCLERDPRQRLRDIGEARIAIDAALRAPERDAIVVAPAGSRMRGRIPWAVAAVSVLVAAAALSFALRPVAVPSETRLDVATPPTDDAASMAISPDGRQLVFVASGAGSSRLWLRPFDDTTARPLAGTDGATAPFWSPDGRSVGFFSNSQLRRLDLGTGLVQNLATLGATPRGAYWTADAIVFGAASGPLLRVSDAGGAPVPVTKLGSGQSSHRFPHPLPGGRQFLFQATGASPGVYLGSLDSSETALLTAAESSAVFVPPNWLLFLRQGTLLAQQFDAARRALIGEVIPVADRLAFSSASHALPFSASSTGVIAYRSGDAATTQLTWFDRSGKTVGTIGAPDSNRLVQPMLSPDGRRVVVSRTVQNNTDVWLFDSARMTPVTFDPGSETYPILSWDGNWIVFSKFPGVNGLQDLYQKSPSGAGGEKLLLAGTQTGVAPMSWHGGFLIYIARSAETRGDLWVLPTDGTQKPYPFLASRFEERMAQFSPDGRWVAYASDQSGPQEIYLRPFSEASGQWEIPVSTGGGVTPRWRRDGKEIYYIAPDGTLMAVSVATTGVQPELGTPTELFRPRIVYGGTSPVGTGWQYDVATDGRFLINAIVGDGGIAPITVIQNWAHKN